MEKIDLKKIYKDIYKSTKINIINYPALKYIVISGTGSPNSEEFKDAIKALYPVAYEISMSYNTDFKIKNYHKFVVSPLEGVWDLIDTSIGYNGNKDNLKWDVMLLMPDFVCDKVLEEAKVRSMKKINHKQIEDVRLIVTKKKTCCRALHIGKYDNEKETFDKMDVVVEESNYVRKVLTHREIYLSDFRKVPEEKLRTILVYDVEKK